MFKQLLYGTLGLGAVGLLSICDLCSPASTEAAPVAATASIAIAATPAPRDPAAAPSAEVKTVRFSIAGMTCGGCVLGTRKVLTRLPGVSKADVSYEKQDAVVTFDPTKVGVEEMVAAVKTLGYTATLVEG